MKRTAGVIDVGSNSVRLMIASVEGTKAEALEKQLSTTRLIAGMRDGILTDDAIERTAQAIREFVLCAQDAGAQEIHIFGTSAMRDAKNASELNDRLCALCGRRVRIISGEEEAALAFAGAAPSGRCGVIDIGGGSTELICGVDGRCELAASARMGAVRLMDTAIQTSPRALVEKADGVIAPVAAKFVSHADKWMGVGGTITTLAAMDKGVDKYSPGAIENYPVTLSAAQRWLEKLCVMPMDERRKIVGLPERRADIIHCGAAILIAVMERLGTETVYACDHDNLEGYIISQGI